MDVARISFAFIIAALHATAALAGGPADWMSAGPPSVSTHSASPSDRYSNPQSGQPTTTSQQVQNWSNSASQQLQTAGNDLRSSAQQTIGNVGYPSQSNNPFATSPQTPAASSTSRNGV